MRNIALIIYFIFQFPHIDYAQSYEDSVRRQQSFLFEHFIDGKVQLKSGEIENAQLNYCSTDQSILFMKEGKMYTLTDLSSVDSIFINEKKFVPVNNSFYEVVKTEGKVKLLLSYTIKMRPLTATADHGGTSTQSASQVNNTVSNVYVSRNYKGDFSIEITRQYWLLDYKKLRKANSLKDFLKVFRESTNQAIVDYAMQKQVDFKNESQLSALVNFSNRQ